ncbi:EEP domain-containing protein [Rhizobium deserti]|uniref:EEP domain-containing protein n=1 Tax=Rhizobium deserti TaxID=2547961 RepID=A0A4R5UP85_9HYPH|nr:endonuclease/exonuclease/phosphatase family protein [Rhizobium deserti]TDK39618.1 EEP domain-containing protein [Rhizobium deserti]
MNDPTAAKISTPRRLKILTYNVHSCIGTDRRLDPARIAEVIALLQPDIIGLQELDVGRSRTGGVDQAQVIASLLSMDFHFHAALNIAEERYGDAILTALPARLVKAGELPSLGEQRGALWVEVDCGDRKLQIFNTHLGLFGKDRMGQINCLLGPEWLGQQMLSHQPRILIGDLNSTPITRTYKQAAKALNDAHSACVARPKATFPSRFPLLRLDHVFVSDEIRVVEVEAVSTPLTRRASDHLPLLATVEV